MIKSLLFTSLLAFSSASSSVFINKVSFNQSSKTHIAKNELLEDIVPVMSKTSFGLIDLVKNHPGGALPAGSGYIRYEFSISRFNLEYLQNFQRLYISLPYHAEQNNLTTLLMGVYNANDTFIYGGNLPLSVSMLYQHGMTLPDLPNFQGRNFLDFNLMTGYTGGGVKIKIFLPILDDYRPLWYDETLNKTNLYDMLPKSEYSYTHGYADGYADGNNDGLTDGYNNGYNVGFNEGASEGFTSYGWLTGIFSAMGGLLGIQLLPGVSIGGIAILIMVLTLLPFLIGLLKGGKD